MFEAFDQVMTSASNIYIYLLICVLLLVIGFPAWVVSLTSGFLYGAAEGFGVVLVITVLSTLLGWCCGFLFALAVGFLVDRYRIKWTCPEVLLKKIEMVRRHSENLFVLVILLKVNPAIPFAFVPFLWGCIVKRTPTMLLLGSIVGSVPLGVLWCIQGAGFRGIVNEMSLYDIAIKGPGGMCYYFFMVIASFGMIFYINKKFGKIFNS